MLNKSLKIDLAKTAGTVEQLDKLLHEPQYDYITKNPNNYIMGIAHTRWPTMGLPTVPNTHPFLSNDKKWTVVLNGIIENSAELTNYMKSQGYHFESDNDVEVVAILLEHISKIHPGDTLSIFVAMLSTIVGMSFFPFFFVYLCSRCLRYGCYA